MGKMGDLMPRCMPVLPVVMEAKESEVQDQHRLLSEFKAHLGFRRQVNKKKKRALVGGTEGKRQKEMLGPRRMELMLSL